MTAARARGPAGPSLLPPPIRFRGRVWSSAELSGLARAWLDAVAPWTGDRSRPVALVLANEPRAVALFFALSASAAPLLVLAPDPRSWRTAPPIPPGTPIFLPPSHQALADEARRAGLAPVAVAEPPAARVAGGPPPPFFSSPGLVFLTSGSTGHARLVYRPMPSITGAAAGVIEALGLGPDRGVLLTGPLTRTHSLTNALTVAALLGVPLGLQGRFDPGALLGLFDSGAYQYWVGVPLMADVLVRYPDGQPHGAPPVCVVSGGMLPEPLARSFRARFGAPLRGLYGMTETGAVSIDAAEPPAGRREASGRVLAQVRVRIGDAPDAPLPPGVTGRVWVSTPWLMAGYGLPPAVEPPEGGDGWWPTRDVGLLDEHGGLALKGRLDDCTKTRAGYLVSPLEIAEALLGHPGVRDALVVRLDRPIGTAIAALVEAPGDVTPPRLRGHLARALPAWAQPSVLAVTPALPRLSSGKVDRRACIARLEREAGPGAEP